MTREEAIEQVSKDFSYDATGGHLYRDLECGFRNGAKWADAHLINPWHKVSEELPKVDKHIKCVKVFARKGDDVFVAFYSVIAGFSLSSSFYTEYALSGVTHWMPIPEIKED